MATITTGTFQEALKPRVKKWFGEYNEYDRLWPQYTSVQKSTDAYEYDMLMSGLGLARIKAEGAPHEYDDATQQYKVNYTHVAYSNGFILSHEAIQDFKAPLQAERFTRSLRRGMEQAMEIVVANHLNRAFSSTYTGGDGKELCATDHPTLGADMRNELSTAADLSETSLEQAIIDLKNIRDHRGLRIMVRPRMLIVPNEECFNSERIVNSNLRPGTADNDMNVIKSRSLLPEGILVNPYLTDTDAWFIITDVEDGLKVYMREEPNIDNDNAFDTKNIKYAGYMRYSSGWTDPRGVFGSPGA